MPIDYDYLIVGAGLSGAVLAERLASQSNKKVLIIDKRDHIAGNCYDYVNENGILMNKYGAHIFHTNNTKVWDYITQFAQWSRWDHKVLSFVDGKFAPVPVNINTVNALCNETIKDEKEMNLWLADHQIKYDAITNSEEMALSRVGRELYEKMFKPYTIKQWNKEPAELDPSVLARIPIRNNFDDRYFTDKYQALPKAGYTAFIHNILAHPNITVQLDTDFFKFIDDSDIYCSKLGDTWKEIIYTGPIDSFFMNTNITNLLGAQNEKLEPLEYRSINFVIENISNTNYYQPVSVVNYPEPNVAFTRIVEYKHFLNQSSPHTTIVREFTTDEGEPYYPVPNVVNLERYEKYKKIAEQIKRNHGIHFIGRLANYKYFNMDEAIHNALVYYDENIAYQARSI